MTRVIFKEYLLWFNIQVKSRKVTYLLIAFQLILSFLFEVHLTGLQYITVIFLLTYLSTSGSKYHLCLENIVLLKEIVKLVCLE